MHGFRYSWILAALLTVPTLAAAQQVRSHAGPKQEYNGPFLPITQMTGTYDGTTLTLEWPRPQGNNGTFSHYDLYYSPTGPVTKATQGQATLLRDVWWDSPEGSDHDFGVLENPPFTQTGTYHVGLTYWYRVNGVEGDEWIQVEFSNDVVIDVDATPPAAATSLEAVGQTESSILLTWQSPGDNGMQGTASSYEFRYAMVAPTGDPEAWWTGIADPLPALPPAPDTAGSVQQILLTALRPETTYYFAFRSADDQHLVSGLSNIAEATTSLRDPGTSSGNSMPSCAGSAADCGGGFAALFAIAVLASRRTLAA